MKRFAILALAAVGLTETAGRAQSSLEMLEKDIEQLKQEHQAQTSKNLDYFFSTLSDASASPQNADKLYLAAGGKAPDPAKVKTAYEHETPTEEAAREAIDQQTMANFDGTLQLHCGMMRLAALFITDPQSPTLQNDWLTWLKNAAQNYPQLATTVVDTRTTPDDDNGDGHHHHHAEQPAGGPDPTGELRKLSMSQSPISSYLGFHGWGDKDQGKWSVSQVPDLYRKEILEPLRKTPSPATLAAWDVYIAMKNADQPDQDQWTSVDLPALQFDKDCDDFASAPSTEKLETLVGIIKANPDHPLEDQWFSRVQAMLKTFQAQKDGGAASASNSAPALPPIQPDALTTPSVVYPTTAPTNSAPATPKP
jgi:hypothetical protein